MASNSRLDEYAVGFVNLAAAEDEEAIAICTMGGVIVVRHRDALAAETLLRRVIAEWDRTDGATLQ